MVLHAGYAFVPASEQSSIIFEEYQRNLEDALQVCTRHNESNILWLIILSLNQLTLKHLPRLDEDTRIVPLLDNLSQGFLAGVSSEWSSAAATTDGEITADMIDDLSRKHFPMCMRHLHESLRRDKHLKHYGRLQYGLFLKVSTTFMRSWVSNRTDCSLSRSLGCLLKRQ